MRNLATAGAEIHDYPLWVSRRLWSLWDLMHKLRPEFFKAYEQAAATHQILQTLHGKDLYLSPPDAAEKIRQFTILADELTALGLGGAAIAVQRVVDILKILPFSDGSGGRPDGLILASGEAMRIQTELSQATSRVPDDLETQVLLALDPRRIDLYSQPEIFGPAVFAAFQSASYDISEAGTCLALDRATACVMHLMRVIEVGLATLAAAVNVKKQHDWGSYLRQIDEELAKRTKASGARTPDEQFFAEASTSIDNMRRSWRNPTMHPEKTYTTEQAEEILNSVRSFMRHLATRLSESAFP